MFILRGSQKKARFLKKQVAPNPTPKHLASLNHFTSEWVYVLSDCSDPDRHLSLTLMLVRRHRMGLVLTISLFIVLACSAPIEQASQLAIDAPSGTEPFSSCWLDLSCSFDEIQSWHPTTRLDFQQYMQAEHLGLLAAADQLGALEGATMFTMRRGLAEPGSWLSYVEAAATEAAERGAAMALGYSNYTGSNPGAVRWFNFFNQQRRGRLSNRKVGLTTFLATGMPCVRRECIADGMVAT
ncbi:hypothetical protein VTN02DRAFT_1478 [Thermoascus thermophilus]